ncbi:MULTISPECIES: hypothetical protein [Legionella]|uniref:Glycosyl hydrolase family 32 N-terminal domain-containing protein n=1 Tax=Legionella steelei TaxID=947033 RepID=A0A0W0ZKV2_9GAMM|nr:MULTISPECIES: hypothetical protein [Legionella]KTD69640.1 hypothetical protein Lste_2798 [Legionella steelei]MBN9227191.1 hypothetical protein [Legionella steelei]OJW07248.1 MAG: hypothetical protein BGO44_16625 [Legionella sp. 39-23]
MKWEKLGHIFCADNHSDWMYSHAMIPIAEQIDNELYRIYFSCRDKYNRGHGAYVEIDMRNPTKILRVHDKPVLEPGELGCFDDSGALPNSIVMHEGKKLLYYTGINLGVTVKIRNSIGLAEWNDSTERFERRFFGPVIDRTRDFPHFVATPEVTYENGLFRAWFTSCIGWKQTSEGPKHFYRLEYAESKDGICWERDGTIAIDFKDEHEYALGVPRVLRDPLGYKMWFCARATKNCDTYRINYATSEDGRNWQRQDTVELDVSASGWDSKMTCYPFVFDYNHERYMLYNGNDYGKTGFGIAVLIND